jgi:hypothetical protein
MRFLIVCALIAFVSSVSAQDIKIENSSYKVSLNESGVVTSLYDKIRSKEYLLEGNQSHLISIRCNGVIEPPNRIELTDGF